jgi:alkanesulfonate monooxygenase SsuD/methylene tetrahydromethanopterin reductase-like flavin-dependent oxidoreductase (luciferase family)
MKKIGFLSFGHWRAAPGSQTRSASDALLQTIELTRAAEQLGIDGAFVRVHHFERQLASPVAWPFSRSRPAWPTGSGGAPAPGRRRSGPPGRA